MHRKKKNEEKCDSERAAGAPHTDGPNACRLQASELAMDTTEDETCRVCTVHMHRNDYRNCLRKRRSATNDAGTGHQKAGSALFWVPNWNHCSPLPSTLIPHAGATARKSPQSAQDQNYRNRTEQSPGLRFRKHAGATSRQRLHFHTFQVQSRNRERTINEYGWSDTVTHFSEGAMCLVRITFVLLHDVHTGATHVVIHDIF